MYRIGREENHLAISGGFAEIRNDKVIMLLDVAERPDEIDRSRAERARERAERRLAGRTPEDVDYTRALAALMRALTRLAVAGKGQ
jgi:F-type H+-transporting ATPase subunit epsilon